MNEFWQSCVNRLEQEVPPQQMNAWIRPLVPLAYDESSSKLRVCAPNRFKLDWVRKNFTNQIERFATEWFNRPVEVMFELPAGSANGAKPSQADVDPSVKPAGGPVAALLAETESAGLPAPSAPPVSAASGITVDEKSRLNTDLTFENFVTGKANQLARAAAIQVAENPGTSYNPLFLYGGVGLGKTHLIHAIGNAIVAAGRGARVRYVHADQYVSDVVKAYQRKAFDEFKRYYHSLDLLLIDDIQFFSGKSATQEQFFYAFEAMVAQRSRSSSPATRIPRSSPESTCG